VHRQKKSGTLRCSGPCSPAAPRRKRMSDTAPPPQLCWYDLSLTRRCELLRLPEVQAHLLQPAHRARCGLPQSPSSHQATAPRQASTSRESTVMGDPCAANGGSLYGEGSAGAMNASCSARHAPVGANTSEPAIFTTWLAQIANCTATQGPLPMGIVRGSRDQDRWDVSTGGGEVPIQVKPSHHRHVDVHDQARCARQIGKIQKFPGGCKGPHGESRRSKETSQSLPHRITVVYY
jgi:hypothetical protein